MSDTKPTVPPLIESVSNPPPPPAQPVEPAPIGSVLEAMEAILRQPQRVMLLLRAPDASRLGLALLLIALVCSLVYGLVIGSFSGGDQYWAAPVKVAGGLLLSAVICLPSLYIFACIGGAQARLVEVFGLLAGLLTLMTVLLMGFAPVAWIFSQSTDSVAAMGALHLVFWFIATWFGARFLRQGFRLLGGASAGSLGLWVMVFVLVMVQMTTTLRPVLGKADTFLPVEKKFFLGHWVDCLKSSVKSEARNPKP